MVRLPARRLPTHPGEMLLEELLTPMGITQRELAGAIHIRYQRVNEIINGKRGNNAGHRVTLGTFFGMSAGFWMNLQLRWDLYYTQKEEAEVLNVIQLYISA